MPDYPVLIASGEITAATSQSGTTTALYPVQLWRYGEAIDPHRTIVLVHGRQDALPDRTQPAETVFGNLYTLAQTLAQSPSTQVFWLDWLEAATDPALPPLAAAGRIQAIAQWAAAQLQEQLAPEQPITFIGHSLGSYVAAEASSWLNSTPEVFALDPAFPSTSYDLNNLEAGTQAVQDFNAVAASSVAWVVQDDPFLTGLAGDNDRAGTAHYSFLVDLDGLGIGLFNAAAAHSAVVDVYTDFSRYLSPDSPVLSRLLTSFPQNRYTHGGSLGDGFHEGVVRAVKDGDVWHLVQMEGDGRDLLFVDEESDRVVSDGGFTTVVTQVSWELPNDIPELVLGGFADLSGSGNGDSNSLYGNPGNNLLRGADGDDLLWGGAGDDRLEGEAGDDRLEGDLGNDTLWGEHGKDWLVGGEGQDEIRGGEGQDTLLGNRGDDWLDGEIGQDMLIGGAGADQFQLSDGRGKAWIEDFQVGSDRLGLAAGVSLQKITIRQRDDGTVISLQDDRLAVLMGVAAAQINATTFVGGNLCICPTLFFQNSAQ